MHGNLPAQAQRAIFPADRNVGEFRSADAEDEGSNSSDKSVGENERWFAGLARFLAPRKTSASLAFLLGVDEEDRNHQRWAGGKTEPKAHVLAGLLRSSEGARVLEYVMRGCRADWWQRHLDNEQLADAFREAAAKCERQLSLPFK